MSAKLYVGNLSWNTNDDTLRDAFSAHGQVLDSIVMKDRETGRSRGFGFVTFASGEEADSAITAMNEQDLDGRRIREEEEEEEDQDMEEDMEEDKEEEEEEDGRSEGGRYGGGGHEQ
ncbi:hypothetical protein BGZ58_002104 [Dissophora ornata]|nr:hypothetical protein BGZ58_002104 [Dissophora ornata]